jgi:acetylornithine/N-succinyldiaminopimelate aminotransferase
MAYDPFSDPGVANARSEIRGWNRVPDHFAWAAEFDILCDMLTEETKAMTRTSELLGRAGKVLIGNYARQPIVMERGEGSWLWDSEGRKYLDLFAGFGGCILGHCDRDLVAAVTEQAGRLWHVGNTFHTEPQIDVGERLNRHAFAGQAFFCHSGLEANEAACKLARLHGNKASPRKWKIVSLTRSFHGRSLAMIAATGNPATRAGFEPDVPGFVVVEAGNFEALAAACDDETAAVLLEPIQGEGGVYPQCVDYVRKVRALCDQRKILLIWDEVWTGCGRTGKWFGYQHLTGADGRPIEPDIMTLGKAVGGGLPVGIMFAKPEIAAELVPGKHGCTLGGNPICMAACRTIFDAIENRGLLERAAQLGEKAMAALRGASSIAGKIKEVRGQGLMIGIELAAVPEKPVDKGLARGIIVNLTNQKVLRLAPALTISDAQWDHGVAQVIELIAAL